MKRFTAMEKVGLVLGVIFIAFGVYSIIHPTEAFVFHPGSGRYQSIIPHDSRPEHVTKSGARVYGFLSLALGAGFMWLALYRARK
jgi:hypothetical protein